jgi:hypothetical protein
VGAAIAEDLLTHLEENAMTQNDKPEIYLRDLSGPNSVDLYFRHGIYKCQPQFIHSAQGNLYFAPYFTKASAKTLSEMIMVPVGEGISYVSRIRDMRVVPRKKVDEFLKIHGVPGHKQVADLVRKGHGQKEILVMVLGRPQLLFVSPVTKDKLARTKTKKKFTVGSMGSRSCTLEGLLKASRM